MNISGWGNNNIINSEIVYPENDEEIIKIIKSLNNDSIITRGLGRSYGDMSLNRNALSLKKYEKYYNLDQETGILECSANVSISEILEKIITKGWFLNVSPGSKFVTIGGAIANDVHGKNHHKDGSFSDYIVELKLIVPDGTIKVCSKITDSQLFRATCGGAGLTGIIISTKIKLLSINSKNVDVKIFKTKNIRDTLKKFKELKNSKYLVAWLDTRNKKGLGRSVVFSGEHSDDNNLDFKIKGGFRLPSIFGKLIMNSFFISIFNRFYYLFHKNDSSQKQDIDNFFYPLDKLSNWNEFYGKRGFTQLQILIKDENKYEEILNQILNFFISKKIYSYLSTLKEYGKGNDNYLSFAENGLSITLDIPIKENFFEIYQEFERIISSQNVKIYLAKDSFMSKNFFKNSYRKISLFKEIKKKIDPESKLQSIQSRRLGL
jgi:decaprenylphospho-beta-D-ribofuranose 2-oxidase